MDKLYTIGEIANEAGYQTQTVRYYERRGLISPLERSSAGYRLYDKGAVRRLLFISHSKNLGFTLRETRELLELQANDILDCEHAKARAEAKLEDVERRIESLNSVRGILKGLLKASGGTMASGECPILDAIDERKVR